MTRRMRNRPTNREDPGQLLAAPAGIHLWTSCVRWKVHSAGLWALRSLFDTLTQSGPAYVVQWTLYFSAVMVSMNHPEAHTASSQSQRVALARPFRFGIWEF